MRPKKTEIEKTGNQSSMFEQRLDEMLDEHHPLYTLAHTLRWENFDKKFCPMFQERGRPSISTRLILGLLYLNIPSITVMKMW